MEKNRTNARFTQRSAGNLFKKMKLLTAFFFAGLLGASASSYSQATKLSLKFDEITLKEAFKQIEKTSEFVFFYNEDYVDINRKVNVNVTDESVETVLSDLLGTLNTFKIYDRQIVILPSENTVSPTTVKLDSPVQQSQKKDITGTVKDNKGQSVPGASVVVKGTVTGTITDAEGQFRLSVPLDAKTLVFSFVGLETKELTIAGKTTFQVTLNEQAVGLDEVVAVGYGTQKRKDLTGAVGQVKSDELTKTPVVGLDQALQGKISGVQVTNNSGEPGGSVSVRIRGVGSINSNNEPLYIVDGVPYGSLNAINVNDIDRIDVLKDAAAASIYGSRASNGVVLVTTKRGSKGLVVSFDAYAGIQSVAKKLNLLNGPQFAKLANENLVNGGQVANAAWSNPATVNNSDWQSAIFQTAPMQNYNLSISSGGENSTTLLSFGYLNQEGIIVSSGYERYTVRLNSDYNLTKKLKVGLLVNGSFDKKENIATSSDYNGVINEALYSQPTSLIKTSYNGLFALKADGSIDPTGNTYFGYNGYSFTSRFANVNQIPTGVNNPLYTKKYYIQNPGNNHSILASAFAEYEIINGLKYKSTLNLTFDNVFSSYYQNASPGETVMVGEFRALSGYNESWSKSNQFNWINTLSYSRSYGNHNVSAIVGIDAQKYQYQFANINTSNVPANQISLSASDGATRIVSGYPSDSRLLSYFGRAAYDYQGKYLVSGTIRKDGSSNFGPNNQYGLFSSGSIGWRVSQEEFMKSVEFISDLKLRASYGTVGNSNIPSYKYLSTYSSSGGTQQYTIGASQAPVTFLYQNNTGDPNIHWEKSIQTDFGLDLAVMKGKLSLTADYYVKKLSDLLGYFPVPSYTGVYGSSVLRNGFDMENKGIELAIDFRQRIGEVNFSANANFSTLDNKVTRLTDNTKGYISQSVSVGSGSYNDGGAETRTYVGQRIGNFYGYLTDGIIQNAAEAAAYPMAGLSPGDRRFKDVNGDGIINGNDKVNLGNGLPKYIFGFSLKADYKAFDFSVLFNGQAGVKIASTLDFQLYNMRYNNSTGIVNGSADLINSWHGEGTSNTLPRNSYTAPTSNRWFSDFSVSDGSFLRISNLQVGYTFKESILSKMGMKSARVFLSGQNLYTFTKYKGYDPELGSRGQNVLITGVDQGRYPLARMFRIGINCKF